MFKALKSLGSRASEQHDEHVMNHTDSLYSIKGILRTEILHAT